MPNLDSTLPLLPAGALTTPTLADLLYIENGGVAHPVTLGNLIQNAPALTLANGLTAPTLALTGNLTKINNVTTAFPSSQGAADYVWQNDGAGALSWGHGAQPNFLNASSSVGAASVTANATPSAFSSLGWVLIDAFTNEAEFRKITTIVGKVVSFAATLAYAHASNDIVLFMSHSDLNAVMFGSAAGTDSTTSVLRALNEVSGVGGSVVDLPTGSFNISSTITIPNFCTLRGVGGRSYLDGGYNKTTQLKWTGATSATAIVVSLAATSFAQLLHVNVHGGSKAGVGVDVTGQNIVMYGCFVAYCTERAIQAVDTSGANPGSILIDWNYIVGDGKYGIWANVLSDSWVTRNQVGSTFSVAGIYLSGTGCDNTFIDGNAVFVCYDGIVLSACRNITVSNNFVHDNQRKGIWLYSSAKSNVVSGNNCSLNGTNAALDPTYRAGIFLEGDATYYPTGNSITGNICGNLADATQQYGIYLYGYALKNTITGNTLQGNAVKGLFNQLSAGQTDNTIANNHGYNPVGTLATPAMPASTVALTNPYCVDCSVYVFGGTVTRIEVGPPTGYETGITSGLVKLGPAQTIAITYSVAPSWRWFGE